MSLARVTTWVSGQVLTAAALNAEFNNILNNPISLISPFTNNVAAGGFRITGLSSGSAGSPSYTITTTAVPGGYGHFLTTAPGTNPPAVGTAFNGNLAFAVNAATAGGWIETFVSTAATGGGSSIYTNSVGSTDAIPFSIFSKGLGEVGVFPAFSTAVGFTATTSQAFVRGVGLTLSTHPATPTPGSMYRGNVPGAWIETTTVSQAVQTAAASFGVASITNVSTGAMTVTWSNQFDSVNYPVFITLNNIGGNPLQSAAVIGQTSAVVQIQAVTSTGSKEPTNGFNVFAIGVQA